jgi:hypothetical protein
MGLWPVAQALALAQAAAKDWALRSTFVRLGGVAGIVCHSGSGIAAEAGLTGFELFVVSVATPDVVLDVALDVVLDVALDVAWIGGASDLGGGWFG